MTREGQGPRIRAQRGQTMEPKLRTELPADTAPPEPGRDAKERFEGKPFDVPLGELRPIGEIGEPKQVEPSEVAEKEEESE